MRHSSGHRGGIATLVRKGMRVVQHSGNEFAQLLTVQGCTSARAVVCNAYLPPTGNLPRRDLAEDTVRDKAE